MNTNGMTYLETQQRKYRLRKIVEYLIREDLPEHRQDLAQIAAEIAALECGCSIPEVVPLDVRMFPNHAGFAQQGKASVIYVRMDMSPFDIARTAAHETRHRWQIETGKFAEMIGKKEHEADAGKFEREFVEKYLQREKVA